MKSPNTSSNCFITPQLRELAEIFPAFDFKQLIAAGATGASYHALQRCLEREVLVKILSNQLEQSAACCTLFHEEARVMGRLNHCNLLAVYDFGKEGEYCYTVMEFVNGSSLYDAVAGQPVEDVQCVEIISAICDGLGHAHKEGVLHNNLNPKNVLLTKDCIPKVAEFCLARDISALDLGEGALDTSGFTAPEAITNPRTIDVRSDIYSIGAVLYFLLTAQVPKSERKPASLLVHSAVEFDYIIDKAMSTNPKFRYRNCTELKEDLVNVIEYLKLLRKRELNQGAAIKLNMVRSTVPKATLMPQKLNTPQKKPLVTPVSATLKTSGHSVNHNLERGRPVKMEKAMSLGPSAMKCGIANPAMTPKLENNLAILFSVLIVGTVGVFFLWSSF